MMLKKYKYIFFKMQHLFLIIMKQNIPLLNKKILLVHILNNQCKNDCNYHLFKVYNLINIISLKMKQLNKFLLKEYMTVCVISLNIKLFSFAFLLADLFFIIYLI